MPELPDIVVYIEALNKRIIGHTLDGVRLGSPFLLRTAVPTISAVESKTVSELKRLGKRICIGLEEDLWLVFHLMIAGRLHWKAKSTAERGAVRSPKKARLPPKRDLAAFEFDNGTLSLTEAGTQRRASLHLFEGRNNLRLLDRGGVELFPGSEGDRLGEFIDLRAFVSVLQSENHTLKRALTDPRLFSGIGNAYSDEILHAARLSPLKLARSLTEVEIARLHRATRETLLMWIERLRRDAAGRFPDKVTAFRHEMAVHGRFKQPCPVCGTPIQRIRYAEHECNYCATCQTGGRLLADRSLSRLLKDDWPRRVDEL